MVDEIAKALLGQRQHLSMRQKACFVAIFVTTLLVQFCVVCMTIAAKRYWLLIPELPLVLLVLFGANLLKAAATSLDAGETEQHSTERNG